MAVREPIPANARRSAIALAVGGTGVFLTGFMGEKFAPLHYFVWLILTFGVLGLAQELGQDRPLNRAALVSYAAGFVGNTILLLSPLEQMRSSAALLHGFTTIFAMLLFSVALAHRPDTARKIGTAGAIMAGLPIGLALASHLVFGTISLIGISGLAGFFMNGQSSDLTNEFAIFRGLVATWCIFKAGVLWFVPLRN